MSEIIKIEKLTKDYGENKGIFDVSLTINKGEIMGLVGVNGAGKSTIMRHIMGYIHQDSGKVEVSNYDAWEQGIKFHKKIGYVPGEISFPDVTTGTAFLKIQAEFKGIKEWHYVNHLIQRLAIDISAPLKRMSKGMKQKMALVVAFMGKPDILILDEPTTGLDPLMRDTVIEMMLEAKERGATIFISSHIMKEFEEAADRVAFIEGGKILEIAEMAEVSGDKAIKNYAIDFADKQSAQDFVFKGKFASCSQFGKRVSVDLFDNEVSSLLEKLDQFHVTNLTQTSQSLDSYFNEKFNRKG